VLHRRPVDGVLPLASLAAVAEQLQRWRRMAALVGT